MDKGYNIYKKIINNNLSVLFILLIISFGLRIFDNFEHGFWYDELLSFYISDPSISSQDLLLRARKYDDNLTGYFWILKFFFKYFGYTPDNARLLSVIFSTLSTFIIYKVFLNNLSRKNFIIYLFLFTTNIFLIWQAKEARVASLVLFFFVINLYCINQLISTNNKKYIYYLFLSNQLLIQLHPFLTLILFSQLIYFFLNSYNFKKKIIILIIINLFLFLAINYDYIIYKTLHKSFHYGGDLEYSFFINYFFRTFFGSISFGALNLLIFSASFIYYLIKLFENRNFHGLIFYSFIIIIVTYLFVIFFSLFSFGINIPRYFIYLIPLILLFQINLLEYFKIKKIFIVLFLVTNLINLTFKFSDNKIEKFSIQSLREDIQKYKTTNIIIPEDILFNNYFKNINFIKENYTIYNDSSPIENDTYLIVCINNNNLPVIIKCNNDKENYFKISKVN